MRNVWAICKRELKSFFTTPVGYVILGVFVALTGLYFAINFIIYADFTVNPSEMGFDETPDLEEHMLSPYLVLCGQIIMFIGPLITMRLLAEERNKGTMELLLTHPIRDREIVFGKYAASLVMLLVLTATLIAPLALVLRYSDVEPAVLGFGLFAVFMMGAAFLSMGLFVSATSNNQVTAGVLTFAVWLVSWVLGQLGGKLPEVLTVPEGWPTDAARAMHFVYGLFRGLVTELPLDAHATTMAQGVVRLQDVAYYVLCVAFFLFLTLRVLESRRWRA